MVFFFLVCEFVFLQFWPESLYFVHVILWDFPFSCYYSHCYIVLYFRRVGLISIYIYNIHKYIYIYIHTHTRINLYIYIYIYIYVFREDSFLLCFLIRVGGINLSGFRLGFVCCFKHGWVLLLC